MHDHSPAGSATVDTGNSAPALEGAERHAGPRPKAPTSSLSRLLNILDLFSEAQTSVHVEDIIHLYGVSQSTGYRYLQELCESGLLAQLGSGAYSLGPRVVELERLLRLSDPLLLAGRHVMQGLTEQSRNKAFLLCTFYKDRVLCIHSVGPEEIRVNGVNIPILRGRGTPLPLFKGAGSHAILAFLPAHRIRALFETNQTAIADSGLGGNWPEFRNALSNIRKQGYAKSFSKSHPRLVGIAVPIVPEEGLQLASLLVLTSDTKEEQHEERRLIELLHEKAAAIKLALREF